MSRLTREAARVIMQVFQRDGWELFAHKGRIYWSAPEAEVTRRRLHVLKVAKKDLLRLLPPPPEGRRFDDGST